MLAILEAMLVIQMLIESPISEAEYRRVIGAITADQVRKWHLARARAHEVIE